MNSHRDDREQKRRAIQPGEEEEKRSLTVTKLSELSAFQGGFFGAAGAEAKKKRVGGSCAILWHMGPQFKKEKRGRDVRVHTPQQESKREKEPGEASLFWRDFTLPKPLKQKGSDGKTGSVPVSG